MKPHPRRTVAASVLMWLMLAAPAGSRRPAYPKALDQQTEKLLIHEGFATALRVRATYLSPEHRRRMAAERARLLGDSVDDHEQHRRRSLANGDAYYEFVFTAESDIQDRTAFGTNEGDWRLRLVADGEEQPLVTVYPVRKPSPLQRTLFPHKNIWNRMWVARFERRSDAANTLELNIGSGYGNGSLEWSRDQLR